jgi:hypothetical protein
MMVYGPGSLIKTIKAVRGSRIPDKIPFVLTEEQKQHELELKRKQMGQ